MHPSMEWGSSFPSSLGTISCLQGANEHLPAARGSPGRWRVQKDRDRTPRGKHGGGSGGSRDSGAGPASQTQVCGKVPRKFLQQH